MKITLDDCKEAFAVPGQNNIIDLVHPLTGNGLYSNEPLEDVRKRYPDAIKVNFAEFWEDIRKRNNTPVEWVEVTEEKYNYGLECLPPVAFDGNNFLVGEPSDHLGHGGRARFPAYIARNGKYYAASRPMTVVEFRECLKK